MTRRWTLIQPLLLLAVLIGLEGRASCAGLIYWTDAAGGDIRRANADGSGSQTLVSGLNVPTGIALDLSGGKMYWADDGGGDIREANLDGSGSQTLVSSLPGPAGIALDLSGGKMYWADDDGGDIRCANLNGSGSQTLVSGLSRPTDVALDLSGGKMYWADWGNGDIRRANLDGSDSQILVSGLTTLLASRWTFPAAKCTGLTIRIPASATSAAPTSTAAVRKRWSLDSAGLLASRWTCPAARCTGSIKPVGTSAAPTSTAAVRKRWSLDSRTPGASLSPGAPSLSPPHLHLRSWAWAGRSCWDTPGVARGGAQLEPGRSRAGGDGER